MATTNTKPLSPLELITPEIIPSIKGIASPFLLYRFDKSDDRYYFTYDQAGAAEGFLSVTSFCKKSLGMGGILVDWMVKMGKEEAEGFARMRADYGTLLHIECVEILRNGKGDFTEIGERAFARAIELGYKHMALIWMEDMVKDVASFMQFCKDYEVEVIFAEFPIASRKWKLGGCIDLGLKMKFGKGLEKINAIVDIKSGRKGFFEAHELQLQTYQTIWNEHFGEIWPVTHVFNWSPTNWRKTPTYKLKNQTKSKFATSVESRMETGLIEGWCQPPLGYFELVGEFTVAGFDFADHVRYNTISRK